jgi:hypothetical protein
MTNPGSKDCPNPFKSRQVKPFCTWGLGNSIYTLETLTVNQIDDILTDPDEDPHYEHDTVFEKHGRIREIYVNNLVTRDIYLDLTSMNMRSPCMRPENETAITAFILESSDQLKYSLMMVRSNRSSELNSVFIKAANDENKRLSNLSDLDAYEMLNYVDQTKYSDILAKKPPEPPTLEEVMKSTNFIYLDDYESLYDIKDKIHDSAASSCSGLDTVYQSKFDLGVLSIAERLEHNPSIGAEIAKQFLEFCDVKPESLQSAKAAVSQSYDDYHNEFCA